MVMLVNLSCGVQIITFDLSAGFFFKQLPRLSGLAFQFREQLWRKWDNEKHVCNTHQREVNLSLSLQGKANTDSS